MNRVTAVVSLLAACSADPSRPPGPETLPDLEVPPPPANGVQVITPIVRDLQPGTDYEICTWTEHTFSATTDIKSTTGYQTEPPGHHVILFYTTEHQPAGTQRACTDTDMASFRYLTGNGTNGTPNVAPGDLVYRIPQGAQLVVNHHYLNAYDDVLDGQSLINVDFATPDPRNTPSSSTAILDTGIEVQPGVDSKRIECTFDRELKLWYLLPHMHRWGRNITVDLTLGGQTTRMFDTLWDDSFTFHPPEHRIDPATPMVVRPGDRMAVRCDWLNDTGRPLPFGFEMCVVFGQFIDERGIGSWACDNGQWTEF